MPTEKLFRPAERRQARLRIALDGPSGSGKTHSALRLALGLVNGTPVREDGSCKIAVIGTERGSAEIEVGKKGIPKFSYSRLDPPFTPERYCMLIRGAEREGFDVIIVDSISHAWGGAGGVLEMTDEVKDRVKNHFAAWRETTPEHNKLVDTILGSSAHVICTVRTKTHWDIQENEKGKKVPVKLGLKPEQREGIEYEFTIVFDLSIEKHIAIPSKDRTSLFMTTDGKIRAKMLTDKHGLELLKWLSEGTAEPAPAPADLSEKEVLTLPELFTLSHYTEKIPDHAWKKLCKEVGIEKNKSTHTEERLIDLKFLIDNYQTAGIPMPDDDVGIPMPEDEAPPTEQRQNMDDEPIPITAGRKMANSSPPEDAIEKARARLLELEERQAAKASEENTELPFDEPVIEEPVIEANQLDLEDLYKRFQRLMSVKSFPEFISTLRVVLKDDSIDMQSTITQEIVDKANKELDTRLKKKATGKE